MHKEGGKGKPGVPRDFSHLPVTPSAVGPFPGVMECHDVGGHLRWGRG